MNIKELKLPISFILSLVLFFVTAGYSLYIYFNWDKSTTEVQYSIEVNLPIIDWQNYGKLTKKPK